MILRITRLLKILKASFNPYIYMQSTVFYMSNYQCCAMHYIVVWIAGQRERERKW